MNLSPEVFAEIFRQAAFISALIAGFSFAFLGVILTSSSRKRIEEWTAAFAVAATAGLLVCALGWTLSVPRLLALSHQATSATPFELPEAFRSLHRSLSKTFIVCFFLFLTSLGLSGWIRSRKLGVVSTFIACLAAVYTFYILKLFVQ
jgi:hypothetical protein